MTLEIRDGAVENVRALLIFSLTHEWKQVLLVHGCTFDESDSGETVIFPEGTVRTMLLSRGGRGTNRSRILFPDGLELREVLDDEGAGKSQLLLVLSQVLRQGTRTRIGREAEEERQVL